ncbi:amino acid adenylation domain-containing protein [Nocardia sp. NPDC051570]|uniref:amino acid adenylation domain-containing protein n=1 Tax=Nocardia sp. NPDC051570 TaxID=3364324 RepID=UPI0037975F6B
MNRDRTAHVSQRLQAARARLGSSRKIDAHIRPRPAGSLIASYEQERMWLVDRILGDSTDYHVPYAVLISGPFDEYAFDVAFTALVRRHEVLRTVFDDEDGVPLPVVLLASRASAEVLDLRSLGSISDQTIWRQILQTAAAHVDRPFHLGKDLPIRACVVRCSEQHRLVVITLHHIATDGFSTQLLCDELSEHYRAAAVGREPSTEPPPLQYADFAHWQRSRIEDDADLDYWVERLSGIEQLNLPADRPHPVLRTRKGAEVNFTISEDVTECMRRIGAEHNATQFMIFMAGFNALLSIVCGQRDFGVGIPVSGRDLPELESMPGFFVNTLVLRTNLAGACSFRDILDRVRESALGAYAHQSVPFTKVVQRCQPERNLSRNALFQVMFTHQEQADSVIKITGATTCAIDMPVTKSKFDLSLALTSQGPGRPVRGSFIFATDIFDAATIQKLADQYVHLLQTAADDPAQDLSQSSLLLPGELHSLLHEWGQGEQVGAGPWALTELILEQSRRTPGAVAVGCAAVQLTYAELAARSRRLARWLRRQGVGAEDVVGVCLERTVDLVVTLLAVLRAGASYLPIDTTHSQQRIKHILADSGTRIVLTDDTARLAWSQLNVEAVDITTAGISRSLFEQKEGPLREGPVGLDQVAYVIYTSGSTGRPKGVMVTHRGVANFARDMVDRLKLSKGDVVGALTTVSFDIAMLELLVPLTVGAQVQVLPQGIARDGSALSKEIDQRRINVLQATPTGWSLLIESGWQGAPLRALCGGEALPGVLAREIRRRVSTLWNLYGPTETTIWSTAHLVEEADAPPPLGRPLRNTSLYVLGPGLAPVPVGTVGELYIGGLGVARGYNRNPGLTAARFVADPFAAKASPGVRMYGTGDLARYQSDGTLEFRGRVDGQVKVRGHRIELAEVEARLLEHPDVAQAAVLTRGEAIERILVAYVVWRRPVGWAKVREELRGSLPDYMVPQLVVELETIPLTPNGKVDRKALPVPSPGTNVDHVPPRTDLEWRIIQVWQQLLCTDQIGIDDDFFELGGDSLRAAQLVAKLRDQLRTEVPLRLVFDRPTIRALAKNLTAGDGVQRIPLRPAGILAPLSFAQQRLWFLDRLRPGRTDYNVPSVMRLYGPLDPDKLHRALLVVIDRHEVLRTRFALIDASPVQVIGLGGPLWREVIDLTGLGSSVNEHLQRLIQQVVEQPFELESGPLLRAALIRLADDEHVLALVMHHAIVDGWSLQTFWSEFSENYQGLISGTADARPSLPAQYADYAYWERQQGDPDELDLVYWRTRLEGSSATEIPLDRPRPSVFDESGDEIEFTVPTDVRQLLTMVAQKTGATPFMVLLAGFVTTIALAAGTRDVVIGTPVAGRGRQYSELAQMIGPLLNTVVLRTNVAEGRNFTDLVESVREEVVGANAHQGLPFEQLVELLRPGRDLGRHPLFQIAFALDQDETTALRLPGIGIESMPLPQRVVKFDLSIAMSDRPAGLTGSLMFATRLFDRNTAQELVNLFLRVLSVAGGSPDVRLSELDFLDPDARARLNPPVESYGSPRRLDELVTDQAALRPEAIAVQTNDGDITYAELDQQANQLANTLRMFGAGPGCRVGVLIPRSIDLVASLLAVSKIGAAFVPMTLGQPSNRVATLLTDANVQLALAPSDVSLPVEITVLDPSSHALPSFRSETAQVSRGVPDDVAYLTYTSGSTGQPKAVPTTHAAAVSYLRHTIEQYGLGPEDTVLQLAAPSFDAAVRDIFAPLASGARLVLLNEEHARDPRAILQQAGRARITVLLSIVPSLLNALTMVAKDDQLVAPLQIRLIATSGEELAPDLARRAQCLGLDVQLVNQYGPTEGTMTSTFHLVTNKDLEAAHIPVGRPIPGRQVLVLSPTGRPLPTGAVGELYLGGSGLSFGYLGAPGLTAQRFLPNPFGPPGSRLYRTGDLGRFDHEGQVHFHGRTDDQVKVRGLRVELGEIEAALLNGSGVVAAAVVPRRCSTGIELIACVVPETDGIDLTALRKSVRETLPEQMHPARYITLPALPVTVHGKLDRIALIEHAGVNSDIGNEVLAPRDRTELQLLRIWEDVLDCTPIDPRENFFELGGHSLNAVEVIELVHERLGCRIPLNLIFRNPTIELLATALSQQNHRPDHYRLIVPLAGEQCDAEPMFLVHPQSGDVCCYVDLARHLGQWRPIYGIEAAGYSDAERPLTTITEMAHRYVEEIRAVAPNGPYLLGGWSFGGNVALEMAALLEKSGETVAFVGIIDARAFGADEIDDWYTENSELARFALAHGVAENELHEIDDATVLALLTRHLVDHERLSNYATRQTIQRMVEVFTNNGRAADAYRNVPKIQADLHLFKATNHHPTLTNPIVNPESWRFRTHGELRVIELPGNHHDLASHPHVRVFADRLKAAANTVLAGGNA